MSVALSMPRVAERVTIQVTAEGENLISDLQKGIVENYRSLLARLSDSEQERLVDALETLVEILGHSYVMEREKEGKP